MRIEKETLNRWRTHSDARGVITKCHTKTGISRATIYTVLSKGEMSVGIFALLSKFFNQMERKSVRANEES